MVPIAYAGASFSLFFIFLLFKLTIESVSTTTALCASFYINQRANNLSYSWFQDPENGGV